MDSKKLHLRKAEPDDVDYVYAQENNQNMWRISLNRQPYNKKEITEFLEGNTDFFVVGQQKWIIEKENEPVGSIDFYDLDLLSQKVGIGIMIDEDQRMEGIGTWAMQEALDYAFDTLGLHQVYCYIQLENESSKFFFDSLGFHTIGIVKDWVKFGNEYSDVYLCQKMQSH